jgi:hypothetical protein
LTFGDFLDSLGAIAGGRGKGYSREYTHYVINSSGQVLETWTDDKEDSASPQEKAQSDAQEKTREALGQQRMEPQQDWAALADSCGGYKFKPANSRDVFSYGSPSDYAVVTLTGKNGFAIMDKQCRLVVPFRNYASAQILNMGSATVFAMHNGLEKEYAYRKWDFFDSDGEFLCGGFGNVFVLDKDVIGVSGKSSNWGGANDNYVYGALSPDGKWIFEPRYNTISGFHDGIAFTEHFYINRSGREFVDDGRTSSKYTGTSCQSR